MKHVVVIDGWNIGGNLGGAQRYGTEIIKELDILLTDDIECFLFLREGQGENLDLGRIKKRYFRSRKKIEYYFEMLFYAVKLDAIYIEFNNGVPMGRRSIITRYDMFPFYSMHGTSRINKLKSRMKAYLMAIKATKIVTISEYSKATIIENIPWINQGKIEIIPCGWQHIKNVKEDESILEKHSLRKKEFFFYIGRLAKNKNINWIFKVADNNPDQRFVVSGELQSVEKFKFYDGINRNIIYTGGISDEEMVGLYRNCKAFIFPSFMEGFGIPPMEALSFGVPIIISNTSSLPEVYGDSAHYIDPNKYDYNLENLLKEPVSNPNKVLERYTWKESANKYMSIIASC